MHECSELGLKSFPLQEHRDLQKKIFTRIQAYFISTNQSMQDHPLMYFKILKFWCLGVSTYFFLLFSPSSIGYHLLAATLLSIMIGGIGFNILHDANHRGISKYLLINKIFSFIGSDLIGISSFFWRYTHNQIHHCHPNVMGKDLDLEQSFLLRYASHQKKYYFHTYQTIYMWLLFPIGLIIKPWKDFETLYYRLKEPHFIKTNKFNLVFFLAGKCVFIFFAFILPLYYYSIFTVIIFYCLIYGLLGLIVAPIFGIAHVNDKIKFYPSANINLSKKNMDFLHQIESSANFTTHNWFFEWYLGGLNFQIEHHLFPYICHLHYPALSKIVRQTCKEFKIEYHIYPSFLHALASHCRWLKKLGARE